MTRYAVVVAAALIAGCAGPTVSQPGLAMTESQSASAPTSTVVQARSRSASPEWCGRRVHLTVRPRGGAFQVPHCGGWSGTITYPTTRIRSIWGVISGVTNSFGVPSPPTGTAILYMDGAASPGRHWLVERFSQRLARGRTMFVEAIMRTALFRLSSFAAVASLMLGVPSDASLHSLRLVAPGMPGQTVLTRFKGGFTGALASITTDTSGNVFGTKLTSFFRGKKPLYAVRSLGSLGGTSCCLVVTNNDRGWVNGTSNLPGDKNFHPFLWRNGVMQDLGTLGGPNSSVGGMNDRGDVTVGGSDTGKPDPLGEDFCGYGTHQTCLSFVWHRGQRILIPNLGGNNNDVNTINNNDVVLTVGETKVHDPTCIAPQVLGFEAFTWELPTNDMHRLPPLRGDSVSIAFDVNNRGDASGYSGVCGHGAFDVYASYHAVLWRHGRPKDLGNLGGTVANQALGLNNRGQVIGLSALRGNKTAHAFLWQDGTMTDLGTVGSDHLSSAGGVNDAGQVAVTSCKSVAVMKCRGALWQNGVLTDLNSVISHTSSLYLVNTNSINARGEIVGQALDRTTGTLVPYLAVPCEEVTRTEDGCDG
jgi:probable HAF family extracellular repeat protein